MITQIATFEYLFLHTRSIYVIEDTGGCVGDFDLITVNYLKRLIDNIMYWPEGLSPREWSNLSTFDYRASWLDKNIVGVAFYRWICFIMRGRNPEDNPYLRDRIIK